MGKKKQRSRLRKLQILLKKGKINPMLWSVHFSDVPFTVVPTCQNCSDFQMKGCAGGRDVIECMIESSKNSDIEYFGEFADED